MADECTAGDRLTGPLARVRVLLNRPVENPRNRAARLVKTLGAA